MPAMTPTAPEPIDAGGATPVATDPAPLAPAPLGAPLTSAHPQPRTSRHAHEAEPPPPSEEVRRELQGELDRVNTTGQDLCHLMGMTSTWGAARWEPGPTPDTLLPTYRVVVKGDLPDVETVDLLVARLTKHGWSGAVLSHEPILRLDAHRAGFTMRLTAEASTIRLTVLAAPVRLGRTLSTWVLAGVYEEDEIA